MHTSVAVAAAPRPRATLALGRLALATLSLAGCGGGATVPPPSADPCLPLGLSIADSGAPLRLGTRALPDQRSVSGSRALIVDAEVEVSLLALRCPAGSATALLVGPAPSDSSLLALGFEEHRREPDRLALSVLDGPPGAVAAVIRIPADLEARDALDGVGPRGEPLDAIATRDPASVRYARSRGDLRVVPLPWDRRYLLTAPSGTGLEAPPDEARRDLAGAVRADARAADPDAPPAEGAVCLTTAPRSTGRSRSIGYPRNDAVARDLAERLVSTLLAPSTPRWLGRLSSDTRAAPPRAVPLDPTELETAIPSGAVGALILVERSGRPAACSGELAPLIETRAALIARASVPVLVSSPDGRLAPGERR
ncbi:MAG: hypothetical protein R2909_01545 [Gemmatimonadales bacterium]